MEKSKSKDNHRAAGKKRLEEFRQKKVQKGIAANASSTVPEKLANDGKLPADLPAEAGGPVEQRDQNAYQKLDTYDFSSAGRVDNLPPEVESSEDGGSLDEARNLEALSPQMQDSAGSGVSRALANSTSNLEVSSNSTLSVQSQFEDNSATYGPVDDPSVIPSQEDPKLGSVSSSKTGEQNLVTEGISTDQNKGKVTALYGANDQAAFAEFESLRKQLHKAEEARKLVSSQLLMKDEQQLEERRKLESLVAQIENIRLELDATTNEKLQLAAELEASGKEFRDRNQQLASDLIASEEQVDAAKREASLLAHDLDLVKKEFAAANAKFDSELQSMQQRLMEGQGKTSQLVADLATNSTMLHGLQGEKASLADELQHCRREIEALNEEMHHVAGELETSKGALRVAETDLAVERRNLKELVNENIELAASSKLCDDVQQEKALLADEVRKQGQIIERLNEEVHNLADELDASKGALKVAQTDLEQERSNARVLAEEKSRLATSSELHHAVQEEKVSLTYELQQCRREVEVLNGEVYHMSGELEASKRAVGVAENDLALERGNLEESVRKNSEVVESSRVDKEALEGRIMAKELELKACRDNLDNLKAENLGLSDQVDEIGRSLERTKRQKGDLQARHATSQEEVKRVEAMKSKLLGEIDKSKSSVESLLAEKSNIFQKFETELEQLREDLSRSREESNEQRNELVGAREELKTFGDKHSEVVREMEAAIAECREGANRSMDEKTAVLRELEALREQHQALFDKKVQEVTTLEAELQELKRFFNSKVEENSSLSETLENSLQLARKLSDDLEQQRRNSDLTQGEKEAREAELAQLQMRLELEKAEAKKYSQELQAAQAELQSSLNALSYQLQLASDEKSTLLGDLHTSRVHLREVLKDKEEVILEFENSKVDWEAEKYQLTSEGKSRADSEMADLISLRQRERELEQEVTKARVAETTLRLDFQTQGDTLAQTLDQKRQLTDTVERLMGEQAATSSQVEGLGDQLASFAKRVKNPQGQEVLALEARALAQARSRPSLEKVVGNRDFASNGAEPELDLPMTLMELEQSLNRLLDCVDHDNVLKTNLQMQVEAAELKIVEKDSDFTRQKDVAAGLQAYVQSLTQRLEQLIDDVLPSGRHERTSSRPDNESREYTHFLINKLHEEVEKNREAMQNAGLEFQITSDALRVTEDEVVRLNKEREGLRRSNEQMCAQLAVAAKEKTKLEASLKDVTSLASEEKNGAISLLNELTEKHDMHLSARAAEIHSLQTELSLFQSRVAELEAAGVLGVETSKRLSEEFQSISAVVALLPVTGGTSEKGLDNVGLSEASLRNLNDKLREGISKLVETCEDNATEIESLKRSVALSSEFSQDVKSLTAENSRLTELLQSAQENFQAKELELENLEGTVDEQAGIVSRLAGEGEELALEVRNLGEQLEKTSTENLSLRTELAQAEQRLTSTREKLSLAVSKGKAVVQQRDGWKLNLEEKSKELGEVIRGHQEILQVKESALQSAEKRVMELSLAAQQAAKLSSAISAAEQVFMDNDDVMVGLRDELGDPDNTDAWRSYEVVDKTIWMFVTVKKALVLITRQREREQILSGQVSDLERTVEDSTSKINALAVKTRSLEQEKDDVCSRFQGERNELQLEMSRLTDENRQLATIVRNVDLDVGRLKHEKEEFNKRLVEQTTKVEAFEKTISSLEGDVAERRTELLQAEASMADLEHEKENLFGEFLGEKEEKEGLHIDLIRANESLRSLESQLGAALSDEKSFAQRNDSLARELMEKSRALDAAHIAHEEKLGAKELHLQKTSQRLKDSLEHVTNLQKEIVTLRNSFSAERSLDDKLVEMGKRLAEAEDWARLAESGAVDAENGTNTISSTVELLQSRSFGLESMNSNLTRGNQELAHQLQSVSALLQGQMESMANDRQQVVQAEANLQRNLELQKEDSEKRELEHNTVLQMRAELTSQVAEAEGIKANLQEENRKLQHNISALELELNEQRVVRSQLQSDAEAAMSTIRNCVGAYEVGSTIDSSTLEADDSGLVTGLRTLSATLVKMYTESVQELEETSNQTSKNMEASARMQQSLDTRAVEFSALSNRLEEADARLVKQVDSANESQKEVAELRTQFEMVKGQEAELSSRLEDAEQKGASLREKLSLAIKKGKTLAVQKESLKQLLSGKELEVERTQEELKKCESNLRSAVHEISFREEQAGALEQKLASLSSSASSLEQKLQEKDNLHMQMGALLTKVNFPAEQKRSQLPERLKWLVLTVADAQKSVSAAEEEAENWKRTSIQLSSQLTDAQAKTEVEQQALSNIKVKLDDKGGELQVYQNRIEQLELQLVQFEEGDQELVVISQRAAHLEAKLQHKQVEIEKAEEALKSWAEKSRNSEKTSQSDQERVVQLEQEVEQMRRAEERNEVLLDKIAKLEDTLVQKEAAVKALESSRGKVVSKLSVTVEKFQDLYRQSEGLVVELERMHESLTQKEAEIARLNGEVEEITGQSKSLQAIAKSKESSLFQLGKLLEITDVGPATIADDDEQGMQQGREIDIDEERCLSGASLLQDRLAGLNSKVQAMQGAVEAKDVQLQKLRRELEDSFSDKERLKSSLQNEQMQSGRLRDMVNSLHASNQVVAKVGEIEEIQAGNHVMSTNSPSPHVRGARRPQSNDVAIVVDPETTQLLSEYVDKGHGFKSLTSSGLMPRGTRALSDQIDKLSVAGGRLLMRSPAARFGLTIYWLAIHMWMVFLVSSMHIF